MNLEQLSRLRSMTQLLDNHWDLSHEDKTAIRAAMDSMPNPRIVEALEAVLLYHSGSPWTSELRLQWANLTGHADATTRGLCDFIRRRLAEAFIPDGCDSVYRYEALASEFKRQTGLLAPGKDVPAARGCDDHEARTKVWREWLAKREAHA